jgi:hypothetical protein
VWPVSEATMSNDGYFHMQIWFWAAVEEKPCVETISCDVRDHVRLQTYVLYINAATFTHILESMSSIKKCNNAPGCPCPVR